MRMFGSGAVGSDARNPATIRERERSLRERERDWVARERGKKGKETNRREAPRGLGPRRRLRLRLRPGIRNSWTVEDVHDVQVAYGDGSKDWRSSCKCCCDAGAADGGIEKKKRNPPCPAGFVRRWI